jgi:hypothetical protein
MGVLNHKLAWFAAPSAFAFALGGAIEAYAEDEPPGAETVFPEGAAFGIAPFTGAQLADEFTGFADYSDSTSVTINELPIENWDEIASSVAKQETWVPQGITATEITNVTIANMPAIRISGTQVLAGRDIPKCIYVLKGKGQIGLIAAQIPNPERAGEDACALITGVAERAPATMEERMTALPYRLGDLGDLRVVRVIGGSGVLLTDGPKDVVRDGEQPVLIVVSSISPAALGDDRGAFALQLLQSFGSYSLAGKPEMEEAVLDGLPAIRIFADAIDSTSGKDVRLAQWVGFLPDGNYLRVIGVADIENWEHTLGNFVMVAAGLERVEM